MSWRASTSPRATPACLDTLVPLEDWFREPAPGGSQYRRRHRPRREVRPPNSSPTSGAAGRPPWRHASRQYSGQRARLAGYRPQGPDRRQRLPDYANLFCYPWDRAEAPSRFGRRARLVSARWPTLSPYRGSLNWVIAYAGCHRRLRRGRRKEPRARPSDSGDRIAERGSALTGIGGYHVAGRLSNRLLLSGASIRGASLSPALGLGRESKARLAPPKINADIQQSIGTGPRMGRQIP